MSRTSNAIETPLHQHGARTPADYAAMQADVIARNRRARPANDWNDPWLSPDHPEVYIGAGKWIVRCACGNCPAVDPTWREARCFECGAVYQELTIPEDAAAISDALLKRPSQGTRNWRQPETVDDLIAENLEHGIA